MAMRGGNGQLMAVFLGAISIADEDGGCESTHEVGQCRVRKPLFIYGYGFAAL